MPILPLENVCFPPNLFVDERPFDPEHPWMVIHTKPRQEKVIARHLHAAELSYFLPLAKSGKPRAARVPDSFPPVFPGYLFIRNARQNRLPFQILDRAVRILDVPDQMTLDKQLQQVWWLIGGDQEVQREEELKPGDRVMIRMGSMAGMKGTLIESKGETRFVVSVDFIQKGLSIVVDRDSIIPAE